MVFIYSLLQLFVIFRVFVANKSYRILCTGLPYDRAMQDTVHFRQIMKEGYFDKSSKVIGEISISRKKALYSIYTIVLRR